MEERKAETGDVVTLNSAVLEKAQTHSDADRLAQLGITEELDRNFSLPSLAALCLCLMGTWEACSAAIAQALTGGGAPALFYNFVITFIASIAIGLSMAEIASIYPTAGGQYHWVTAMHPKLGRKAVSWLTGWTSIGAQAMLSASAAFAAALMIQGLIIMNNPDYHPQRWHAMLLYWGILIYGGSLNLWGDRLLPTANIIAGVIHVVGFVAIFCTLAVVAPKNSAHFVFAEVYNQTGWQNNGVAWLTSLISTVYPFLGYDAACHLAEELPHASRNVPLAILGSIVTNGLMGLAYTIMILYSTPSLEKLLSSPTGLPFIQIYLYATSSRVGTTILVILPMISATTASVAALTSCSRTLWSFARDKATPISTILSRVGTRNKVPTYSILSLVIFQMLLGFIYLGNVTAFNALISMAIIGTYTSYLPPITCMLNERRKLSASDYGPFKLPKLLGAVVNIFSVFWLILVIIFCSFPNLMPVTAANMNYSCVVIGGWVIIGLLYYVFGGQNKFQMPVIRQHVISGMSVL